MPNWCSNTIEINGDKDTIACIKYALETSSENKESNKNGVFMTLIGIPSTMSEEQYDRDWYDTNILYYGTKWDIDYDEYAWNFDEDYINVNCETAWSPPISFLYNLMVKYKGLTECSITYEECGVNFAGRAVITRDDDGEVIIEDDECTYAEGLYKYDNDYFWHKMPDDIESFVQDFEDDTEEEIKNEFMKDLGFLPDEEKQKVLHMLDEAITEFKQLNEQENEQEA